MKLIEFIKSARSNSERCLYALYYALHTDKIQSLTSKAIRDKLSQSRIPKAKSINVSDYLSKSGHLVDFKETNRIREWFLTKSGIIRIEEILLSRTGEIPALGQIISRNTAGNKIDVLFLGLGPANEERLRLDEETREIESKIRSSEFRENFNFKSKWAVRPADLFQHLHEIKPHVVHLSGHGSECGGIAFEDSKGDSKLVSATALADAFSTMKDNIKVVLLNACHSNLAAKEIAKTIDCSIGIADVIEDESAIKFASAFYSSLGFGHSVLRAFREARSTLIMEGLPGDHLVELYSRAGVDPSHVILI